MLILSQSNSRKLAPLYKDLPQGVILSGQSGIGITTIARDLAGDNLTIFIEPINKTTGEIDHLNGTIPIERVRELYTQTRSLSIARQVIILDNSERLSPEAQSAFLKLLEEPIASVHFILVCHNPSLLLPTIRSRAQLVELSPASVQGSQELVNQLIPTDSTRQNQTLYLATGLPAEIYRLSSDINYFQSHVEIMTDTKILLSSDNLDKIRLIQKYYRNRSGALNLLDSALMVLRRGVNNKVTASSISQLDSILTARESISHNLNIKLQLLRAML